MALAQFLIDQVNKMEDASAEDKARRLIWNRIPSEIHDSAALAHELLWRVERELPEGWEDGDEVRITNDGKRRPRKSMPNGKVSSSSVKLLDKPPASRTWRFSPS